MKSGAWWKALSVIILLYVFIAGFLVPLKPGIVGVNPSVLQTGETMQVQVTGYNTHFDKGKDTLRAWLKMDNETSIAARSIKVRNDRQMDLEFSVPEYLPTSDTVKDFALILDNEIDGASVLPSAVFIKQKSVDPELAAQVWKNDPVEELHRRAGMTFPFRNIIYESIRNTYFHVPLWFSMLFLFLASVVFSIRFLRNPDLKFDNKALGYTKAGVLMGVLGLLTGAIWAKHTWGAYWSWDVKQNMTAVALLIYFAYFVLRGSFEDPERKARLSAAYNIFAFTTLIPLIYVIPRLTDSLHPGAGGNPAFGSDDLDNTMRMVFYPAIIGWTLLGFWMAQLSFRAEKIRNHLLHQSDSF